MLVLGPVSRLDGARVSVGEGASDKSLLRRDLDLDDAMRYAAFRQQAAPVLMDE